MDGKVVNRIQSSHRKGGYFACPRRNRNALVPPPLSVSDVLCQRTHTIYHPNRKKRWCDKRQYFCLCRKAARKVSSGVWSVWCGEVKRLQHFFSRPTPVS